jgi:hypothetical protein
MSLTTICYFISLQYNSLFPTLIKCSSMLARVSALESDDILCLAETIFTNICNELSDITLFAALGCWFGEVNHKDQAYWPFPLIRVVTNKVRDQERKKWKSKSWNRLPLWCRTSVSFSVHLSINSHSYQSSSGSHTNPLLHTSTKEVMLKIQAFRPHYLCNLHHVYFQSYINLCAGECIEASWWAYTSHLFSPHVMKLM